MPFLYLIAIIEIPSRTGINPAPDNPPHDTEYCRNVQDRDGAVLVLNERTRRRFPLLRTIFADSAYGGPKLAKAIAGAAWKIEVVKKPKDQKGFEVLPRRWVVERTIAWINRCRRLSKDFENLNRSALAFIRLASIRIMLRRLVRLCSLEQNSPPEGGSGNRDQGSVIPCRLSCSPNQRLPAGNSLNLILRTVF